MQGDECIHGECPLYGDCPWRRSLAKCAFYAFYTKAHRAVDKVVHLEAKVAAQAATIQVMKKRIAEAGR